MRIRPLKTYKIITIQRPSLWFLSVLGMILVVLVCFWQSYEYGRKVAGYDRAEAADAMDHLYQKIQQMKLENDEISHHNAMLKRNRKINDDVGNQIQMSFSGTQAEVQELKKELEFYKSIITPSATKRSVVIQTAQLIALEEEGRFKYKITVSQKGRNDLYAKGTIIVSVIGKQEGKAVTLRLHEISKKAKKIMKFGFKYFQTYEGTMEMPENFWPEFMRVQAKPKSSQIVGVDQQYAWSDLTVRGLQYVGQ